MKGSWTHALNERENRSILTERYHTRKLLQGAEEEGRKQHWKNQGGERSSQGKKMRKRGKAPHKNIVKGKQRKRKTQIRRKKRKCVCVCMCICVCAYLCVCICVWRYSLVAAYSAASCRSLPARPFLRKAGRVLTSPIPAHSNAFPWK